MKLTFFAKPPQDVYLAFSGGIDSCVLLHNLLKRKIKVTLLHVHHNTPWCDKERDFAKQVAKDNAIKLQCFSVVGWTGGTSKECFWSKHRNDIFQKMSKPVLTGHHLDDAIEWYVMSTFQGTVKLLDHRNKNVLRPMLGIRKQTIYEYAKFHHIEYLIDPSNSDTNLSLRNNVRINLLPQVETIFPGISTTVLRLIKAKEARILSENKL